MSFLVSRLMSGSYVAFRQAGDVLTEETAVAARSSAGASGDDDGDDSAEALLHSEEQVRVAPSLCTRATLNLERAGARFFHPPVEVQNGELRRLLCAPAPSSAHSRPRVCRPCRSAPSVARSTSMTWGLTRRWALC